MCVGEWQSPSAKGTAIFKPKEGKGPSVIVPFLHDGTHIFEARRVAWEEAKRAIPPEQLSGLALDSITV